MCDEAHSHKWDDFGSLEDSASFASFLEAAVLSFLESGSTRLFCFLEVALAILLILSSVAEAGMDRGQLKLWLEDKCFQRWLPCPADIQRLCWW